MKTAPEPALQALVPEPPPAGEEIYLATPRQGRSSVKIKLQPAGSSQTLGEVLSASQVRVIGPAPKKNGRSGCSLWLQADPVGYLCRDEVVVRTGTQMGDGAGGPRHRYQYGVVASPTGVLRRGDGVTVVGEARGNLLRTSSHFLVRRADVNLITPSGLKGRDLSSLPPSQRFQLGWLVPSLRPGPPGDGRVPVQMADGSVRRMERYAPVWVQDDAPAPGKVTVLLLDEENSPVGEVEAPFLRRVTPVPPPPDLSPGEHWIDVSLSQQVVVAYEGRDPVYATLTSTSLHATPPGQFFIHRKYRTQTMANLLGASSKYDFREVPHAQFFVGRIGLHAALWHDLLGHPVSHGCVNLSPADAERLFAFTSPALPAGWHSITSSPSVPDGLRGSRVVVRR